MYRTIQLARVAPRGVMSSAFLPQSVVRRLLFSSRHSPFTINHVFGRGNCVAAPPCVRRKGKELDPRNLSTNPAAGDLRGGRPLLLDLH